MLLLLLLLFLLKVLCFISVDVAADIVFIGVVVFIADDVPVVVIAVVGFSVDVVDVIACFSVTVFC